MYKYGFHGLTGEVVTQEDFPYEDCRRVKNAAVQRYPLCIVYCRNVQDIRNALNWARKNGVPIRIRSCGGSCDGYSVGNGVLVIDVGKMDGILLDTGQNTVTVEAGVTLKALCEKLSAYGIPFPAGTHPSLSVCGFALGGGLGYSSRMLGLGCDSMQECVLVNCKGELITANPHCNQDLFWALRGAGGGSFGVVTSMKFRLPEKAENITHFAFLLPDTGHSARAEFLSLWQELLPGLSERLTLGASLYCSAAEGEGVSGQGLCYGDEQEAREELSVLTAMPGMQFHAETLSPREAMQKVFTVRAGPESFRSAGRFVYTRYGSEELDVLAGLTDKAPAGSAYAAVSLFSLGGRIAQVKNTATAYYYRDAHYILGIHTAWEKRADTRGNEEWFAERFRALKPMTYGSYANFPYAGLTGYEVAYYGQNVFRLRQIKQMYDPYNIFSHPQSIRML